MNNNKIICNVFLWTKSAKNQSIKNGSTLSWYLFYNQGQYHPKNLSDSRKYSCAPFGSTERLNRSNFKQKPNEA